MEPVTIKAVAERSGVAVSSVSRVLNDHPDVSEHMRARVLEAALDLGYEPDFLAQSLRSGTTRSVGFLLRDLSNPLFADIVKGAEQRLRMDGYSLLLMSSEGDKDLDAKNLRILRQRRVDGFLLSLQSESNPAVFDDLAGKDVPHVLIDREIEGVISSIVRCDHHSGVRQATKHLLALGHRRIAAIWGPPDVLASRDRLAGFTDALKDADYEVDGSLVRMGSYATTFGDQQMSDLLSLADPPTAVITGSVQLTLGVLRAAEVHGLQIGRDLALVSCDDNEFMLYTQPQISVIRRDGTLIGRLASELLLDQLKGSGERRSANVPTEYVARGSSAPPSGSLLQSGR